MCFGGKEKVSLPSFLFFPGGHGGPRPPQHIKGSEVG